MSKGRINALFRKSVEYRQVIQQSSTVASTRCWPEFRLGVGRNPAFQRDFQGVPTVGTIATLARRRYRSLAVACGVARVSGEQAGLGRRPTRGQRPSGAGSVFATEVGEDLLDHLRVFDAGDDLDAAAASLTGLDVDVEYPLQAQRLKLMAARRSAGVVSSGTSDALALLPLPRLAGVTRARCALLGANTPWNRVRLTLGLGTSATSGFIRT